MGGILLGLKPMGGGGDPIGFEINGEKNPIGFETNGGKNPIGFLTNGEEKSYWV